MQKLKTQQDVKRKIKNHDWNYIASYTANKSAYIGTFLESAGITGILDNEFSFVRS
jgi:GrpB-like predicted nucleotidyltransferase (UPF0157 family)